MSDDHGHELVDGQMTFDDGGSADPAPDPGNSDPDQWTRDLTDGEHDAAAAAVNDIAVDLPEPPDPEQPEGTAAEQDAPEPEGTPPADAGEGGGPA